MFDTYYQIDYVIYGVAIATLIVSGVHTALFGYFVKKVKDAN